MKNIYFMCIWACAFFFNLVVFIKFSGLLVESDFGTFTRWSIWVPCLFLYFIPSQAFFGINFFESPFFEELDS